MSDQRDRWEMLIASVDRVEAELAAALQRDHGLGLSEYRALLALQRSPSSELRLQELAVDLRLNQSSVSRLAERLERRGLVKRDPCPADKRGIYAVLTDAGRSMLDLADASYEASLQASAKMSGVNELLTTWKRPAVAS